MDRALRQCLDCSADISDRHGGSKRCVPCATYRRNHPGHTLTPSQQRKAISLAGTMFFYKIAKEVGVSVTNLRRYAQTRRDVNWDGLTYRDDKIREVAEYYQTHTLEETVKKFPEINVRSIVGKYVKANKCIKWSEDEIISLYKYMGLCPWIAIAKKLGRGAFGVISKRRMVSGRLQSLEYEIAKHFVGPGCAFYRVVFVGSSNGRWVSPWVEIAKHLKDGVPDHIKDAIKSLARFQTWLHGSEENIYKALREKL